MFNWINASWKDAYRLKKLTQVLSDYRQVILAETSLKERLIMLSVFAILATSGQALCPLDASEYSSDSLLVMERVHGTIVTDLTTLKDNRVNLSKLSQLGVEIFHTNIRGQLLPRRYAPRQHFSKSPGPRESDLHRT